jgi:arginine deiminase
MLRVRSETGRLRQVLCHEPGREVDRMIPDMMEELLFDDILHGEAAREEHSRLRRLLTGLGVEVLEAQELLTEALSAPEARQSVVGSLVDPSSDEAQTAAALAEPAQLAELLVGGLRLESPHRAEGLSELYGIPPLPNYCFQRDPQAVIGNAVGICTMANRAREREALLSRLIFKHHPRFAGTELLFDPTQMDPDAERWTGIEGGDLLVLAEDVVAVGQSERTNRAGINLLGDSLARREGMPRWLIIVEIPHRRAFMHLDTLFTPVDENACLVYPPVILDEGSLNPGVFLVDLHKEERAFVHKPGLLSTLAGLGCDLEPIACGGSDPVAQQREQWTDGANAMALAPGVITVYDRNLATADELARHGFDIVTADDVIGGKTPVALDDDKRVAIQMPSNELSRARGGPHCLLHPLVRD